MATPGTQVQALTTDVDVAAIQANINATSKSFETKLAGMIAGCQARVDSADKIINGAAALEEPWKMGKKFVKDLLAPALELMPILDLLSGVHPAIGVVVGIFKVLIQTEMQRQDNDKAIAVIFHTTTATLAVLSYLDPVFAKVDGLKTQLEAHLKTIADTINRFGNFCLVYYKHSTVAKLLLSSKYKDELAGFAKSFADHKQELHFLVVQRSAVQIDSIENKVSNIGASIEKITEFINLQSKAEHENEGFIQDHGGVERIIQSDALIKDLAEKTGDTVTGLLKHTVRTDLQVLLNENMVQYQVMMDGAVRQMELSISRSERVILTRLDAGAHDMIEDEDIKKIWKSMGWTMTCKARAFVDAVHYHYQQVFSNHHILHGEPHPDLWTLYFVSKVIFYPAIGYALDEDGSGFISVHEANNFTRSKPNGWTLPQWLAYWAVGPYKTDLEYTGKCNHQLRALDDSSGKVLPANKEKARYLMKIVKDTRILVDSLYTNILDWLGQIGPEADHAYAELDKRRVEIKEEQEAKIRSALEKTKYRFANEHMISVIIGSECIERGLYCLLYLFLVHCARVLRLASKKVIDKQDFFLMRSNFGYIVDAVNSRIANLRETWRQQRLDFKQQIEAFSNGIFEGWYQEYMEDKSDDGVSDQDDDEDDGDDENDEDEDAEGDEDDTASVLTSKTADDNIVSYLVYPLPDPAKEPEHDSDLNTSSDDSDGEKKKYARADPRLLKRVTAMEDKLKGIDEMLRLLLGDRAPPHKPKGKIEAEESIEDEKSEAAGDEAGDE